MKYEQSIQLGAQELALLPENQALAQVIRNSENQQAAAIIEQDRLRRDLSDFQQVPPEFSDIKEKIDQWFEIPDKAPQAPYAQLWENMKDGEGLKQLARLRGQTVLDLGNGQTTVVFQRFIKKFGAKAYIGVDSRNALGSGRRREHIDGFGEVAHLDAEQGDPLEGVLVRGDLLRVATRLPDNSVSVALNGIDNFIVNTASPYGQRLSDEIKRILHPDGLIFGLQSQAGLLSDLLGDESLSGLNLPLQSGLDLRPESGFYLMSK
jgi:hypothetical protein